MLEWCGVKRGYMSQFVGHVARVGMVVESDSAKNYLYGSFSFI